MYLKQRIGKNEKGQDTYCLASKSKSHPDYPPSSSVVRAHSQLGGYYAVEIEEGLTSLWFFMECDLKISMFIAK